MTYSKFGLITALIISAGACASTQDELPPDEGVGISEDAIANGYAAPWSLFNPVGALANALPDGSYRSFCTATLVAPNLVLTAKHCTSFGKMDEPVFFAIGFDSSHPDRVVEVNKFVWERTVSNSVTLLGADAGIGVLAEAISNIQPVSLVAANTFHHLPYANGLIWPGFMIPVGYGYQTDTHDAPVTPNSPFGTRFLGISRVAGISGDGYWPTVYGAANYAEFRADTIASGVLTEPLTQAQEDDILDKWNNGLILSPSDVVALSPTNPQPGDSGGPLLRFKHGRLKSYGIASGVIVSTGDDDDTIAKRTTIYTAFTPEVLHFVDSAKTCGTVPIQGQCNGATVERCSGINEGSPHIITEACANTCAQTPAGASCLPACNADSDCDSTAPGGVCNNNVCSWSSVQQCTGEPGDLGCLTCCLANNSGPAAFVECLGLCPFPSTPSASNDAKSTSLGIAVHRGNNSAPIQP